MKKKGSFPFLCHKMQIVEAKNFQQDDEREGEAEKGAEGGRGQYFGLHQPQLST